MRRKFGILFIIMTILTAGLTIGALAPGARAAAPEAQATVTAGVQAEVVAAALNVRQGPGVNYPVVAVAHAGETLTITGTNAGRTWLQVARTNGSPAWISGGAAYTRLQGLLDTVPVVQAEAPAAVAGTGGGKLVFMTASGGDIYRINADGSGLQLLTQGGLDPALSPDGQQIAFTRWGLTEGVYVMNADGSNEHQVLAAHEPKAPAWSPDGTQLVFTMPRGGRLDKERECKYTSSKDEPNLPQDAYDIERKTIEKDKKYEFCYTLPARPAWQLRKVDLATGQYTDLSSDYGSFGPAWDPRQDWRVIYSGDVSLVQLDVNQNTRTSVAEGNQDRTPAFSPDGSRLAMAHKDANDHWTIDSLNLDGGQRLTLASAGNNISPTWSPDGSQIAFLSDRSGPWEIWVMNADGTGQRPMFAPGILSSINFEFHEVDEKMLSWGP